MPVGGISERERARRAEWNRENRRVIDLRSVTDREGAVHEVLKYLTKVADFSDLPEAVEPFMNAVKGSRLIQTFGTWYGVNLDTDVEFDPEHFEDWGEMKCACGANRLEPGQADSITFKAPAPGDYPYICTNAGHHTVMKGVLHSK